MKSTPVPLAPSIIKSLAASTRRSIAFCGLGLTHSQTLEAMARILGHASWHAAQHQKKDTSVEASRETTVVVPEHLKADFLLYDKPFRARLYRDLISFLDAGIDPLSAAHSIAEIAMTIGETKRYALGQQLGAHLESGHALSEFFTCLRHFAPFEMMAIQAGDKGGSIKDGIREAGRLCS